jgi:lipopolysaccharide assembly protein A
MSDEAAPAQEAGPSEPPSGSEQIRADAPVSAPPPHTPPRVTLAGRVWAAIIIAVIVLVLLIIFIAENSQSVTISFLGATGHISLGLAMLIAALAGAVITLLVGTTRIFQLRREVRRQSRRAQSSGA